MPFRHLRCRPTFALRLQVDRILRAAATGDVFALESALSELDGCDKTAEAACGVRPCLRRAIASPAVCVSCDGRRRAADGRCLTLMCA